tara:strand:+ start:5142 stop:5564 length:423 start_codon:yes stop_codon:yes gene_type:complete
VKPKKLTLKDEVKKQMQNDANKSIADMMRTMGALSAILGEHDLWTDEVVQSNPIKVMFCWLNDDGEIIVRLLCVPSIEEFKKDAQVATEVMVHVDSDTFGDREKLYQVMGFLNLNNINHQFCSWDDDPEEDVEQDRGSVH